MERSEILVFADDGDMLSHETHPWARYMHLLIKGGDVVPGRWGEMMAGCHCLPYDWRLIPIPDQRPVNRCVDRPHGVTVVWIYDEASHRCLPGQPE
jgi:hypothetical protein